MDRRLVLAGASLALVANRRARATEAGNLPDRFAETLTSRDMAAFAALFADDYVNRQVSAAAPPPQTTVSQKQATVDFFAMRVAAMPDLRVGLEAVVAAGDKAAASFVYTGTHGGPYFGFAPTGKPLRFTSCDIFRLRDGLVVEHWGMGDIAGVLAQLRA